MRINESARLIKKTAARMGESLTITMVVRALLRSYRLEINNSHGHPPQRDLGNCDFNRLSNRVLKEEVERISKEKVQISQIRLAYLVQTGDDTRIKAERDGLEAAISRYGRLSRRGPVGRDVNTVV
jgi:hypothetical protein